MTVFTKWLFSFPIYIIIYVEILSYRLSGLIVNLLIKYLLYIIVIYNDSALDLDMDIILEQNILKTKYYVIDKLLINTKMNKSSYGISSPRHNRHFLSIRIICFYQDSNLVLWYCNNILYGVIVHIVTGHIF